MHRYVNVLVQVGQGRLTSKDLRAMLICIVYVEIILQFTGVHIPYVYRINKCTLT